MQIIGLGKMHNTPTMTSPPSTLKRSWPRPAPIGPCMMPRGTTHGHQYETIMPSVFLAVEILPEGTTPPQ